MHTCQRRHSGVQKLKSRAIWDLCSSPKCFRLRRHIHQKVQGKRIGEGVRYGFSGSCWPSSKSKSFAACRSRCLVAYIGHLRRWWVARRYHFCLQKKRHPHDLLTRRALCRIGMFGAAATIQRRRRQPLSNARAKLGAVFTQHRTGPRLGPRDSTRSGPSADTVNVVLTQNDPTIGWRKLAEIDSDGQTAFFHGDRIKSIHAESHRKRLLCHREHRPQ